MPGAIVGGYDTGNNIKLYYIRDYARDNPDEGMTHFLLNSTQCRWQRRALGLFGLVASPRQCQSMASVFHELRGIFLTIAGSATCLLPHFICESLGLFAQKFRICERENGRRRLVARAFYVT